MAALGLHWIRSIILIAITSGLPTVSDAYTSLIGFYFYANYCAQRILCLWRTSALKIWPARDWAAIAYIKLWIDPLHAVVYFTTCGFLLFSAFAEPEYSFSTLPYYIVPSIGLSVITQGTIWWLGLHLVMIKKMKELVVTRFALVVPDPGVPGQYLQRSEVIRHEWHVKVPSSSASIDGHEMNEVGMRT